MIIVIFLTTHTILFLSINIHIKLVNVGALRSTTCESILHEANNMHKLRHPFIITSRKDYTGTLRASTFLLGSNLEAKFTDFGLHPQDSNRHNLHVTGDEVGSLPWKVPELHVIGTKVHANIIRVETVLLFSDTSFQYPSSQNFAMSTPMGL